MIHHKKGHPTKDCLHCELGEFLMQYLYKGIPTQDVVMMLLEIMAVYIATQDDDYREKLLSRVETGFREMVFGGAADEIRTLIMHEDGVSH